MSTNYKESIYQTALPIARDHIVFTGTASHREKTKTNYLNQMESSSSLNLLQSIYLTSMGKIISYARNVLHLESWKSKLG